MDKAQLRRIQELHRSHRLSLADYEALIVHRDPESAQLLQELAQDTAKKVFGNRIYIRGLLEISNICKNNCRYCGIRRGNPACDRYRLSPEEILSCARKGYALGFRTIVMQGGEDSWFTDDRLEAILRQLKRELPDCALTLSLGERSRESYQRLYEAGADRYLLRHETADQTHYALLHPAEMSYAHRMECLTELHRIGYQTGCGFMVGSPGQTSRHLALDLQFVQDFSPEMCGIGPFIPHKDTEFREEPAGSVELTCYLLSILRLIHPHLLLPATTALGTLDSYGREKGILCGANVVMPNLSPPSVREKYMLYDNKLSTGPEDAQNLAELKQRMLAIGYEVVCHRGDYQEGDTIHGCL